MEVKKGLVDFHFHTNNSDGSASVDWAVAEAKRLGVVALALTDHNTGRGVKEFVRACDGAGIVALEGVEIYVAFPQEEWAWDLRTCGPVPDMTILGKELDWDLFEREYAGPLRDYQEKVWLPRTLEKLRSLGLKVPELTDEEIAAQVALCKTPPPILQDIPVNKENWPQILEICRRYEPEFSMERLQKKPFAAAVRYAYSFGYDAYFLRGPQEFGVWEAVDLAERMGGVIFAAHPGGSFANWSQNHLNYFAERGGGGIEVWQYYHKPEQIRLFSEYALRYDLLVSGGSDWHGVNNETALGCWDKPEVRTPIWVVDQLLEKLP